MDKPETPAAIATVDAAVRLSHWGLIRAAGPDAASFLHGQLTNGIADLGAHEVRLAGFCSAKGRLQASFLVWRDGPETLLLACHASVFAATLKRLSMFVLRSKCKLVDAGADAPDAAARLVCTGLTGAAADAALAAAGLTAEAAGPRVSAWQQRAVAGGHLLQLPAVADTRRAVWVAPAGSQPPGAETDAADADSAAALDHWRWLEVQSGVPVIEVETADQFVPQMINFEVVGGVDFQKGCYPGQEVVARSQYRGTVKRRMFLFDVAGACAPGQEVFHRSDASQPAGMVVNAAPRPTGSGDSALVEVKLAALDDDSLHLDSVDGPLLTRVELPYPVTAASET